MTHAIAIIGAGYGDCGKGLATDFLTRKLTKDHKPPLVVRGNGGAQAGHTVVADNRRHIFGHIGAGAFTGAETYLASNFIVNPLAFNKEFLNFELFSSTLRPRIYACPSCRVTTIYDMAINSLAELARGSARHGSCGLGINETVTRDHTGYHFDMSMVKHSADNVSLGALEAIRNEWIPQRLKELSIDENAFKNTWSDIQKRAKLYLQTLKADPLQVQFELVKSARKLSTPPVGFFNNRQDIIVEGAQGLMLDEFLGSFPHVTRSITGLPSAIRAAHECGKFQVRPVYVTRSYTTRHGAGPLPHEGTNITNKALYDDTNVTNDWQGTLRYAPLDLSRMKSLIHQDLERAKHVANAFGTTVLPPLIFLTCVDQLGDYVTVFDTGLNCQKISVTNLSDFIQEQLGITVAYEAHGPTAKDVRERI